MLLLEGDSALILSDLPRVRGYHCCFTGLRFMMKAVVLDLRIDCLTKKGAFAYSYNVSFRCNFLSY